MSQRSNLLLSLSTLCFIGCKPSPAPPPTQPAPPPITVLPPSDPCEQLPPWHKQCIQGIAAHGNSTCVYSESRISCFGPDVDPTGGTVEISVPKGPPIHAVAYDREVLCTLRAGQAHCLSRVSGQWISIESELHSPARIIDVRDSKVCTKHDQQWSCVSIIGSKVSHHANAVDPIKDACKQFTGIYVNSNCKPPIDPTTLRLETIKVAKTHACVIDNEKKPYCWGNSERGQTGSADLWNKGLKGNRVDSVTNVKQVAVGDYHSCALTTDSVVMCWGRDLPGIFQGATKDSPPTIVQLTADPDTLVALDSNGKLWASSPENREWFGLRKLDTDQTFSRIKSTSVGVRAVSTENHIVTIRQGQIGNSVLIPLKVRDVFSPVPCAQIDDKRAYCFGTPETKSTILGYDKKFEKLLGNFTGEALLKDLAREVVITAEAICAITYSDQIICVGMHKYHWHYFNGPWAWVGNHLPSWIKVSDSQTSRQITGVGKIIDADENGIIINDKHQVFSLTESCQLGRCEMKAIDHGPLVEGERIIPGWPNSVQSKHEMNILSIRNEMTIIDKAPGRMPVLFQDTARWLSSDLPILGYHGDLVYRNDGVLIDSNDRIVAISVSAVARQVRGLTCGLFNQGELKCWQKESDFHDQTLIEPFTQSTPRTLFTNQSVDH